MKEPGQPLRRLQSLVSSKEKGKASRHSPMHAMVEELLGRVDPDGYRELLAGLRAEYRPFGRKEEFLVERLAAAAWRSRGCFAMETEILRKGMQMCPGGENAPGALLHAYTQDFRGPDLLSKLSVYESRLQSEFSYCVRELERCGARRRASQTAEAAALEKLKPCTSVVQ